MTADELWKFVGRRDVFARQNSDGTYTPIKRPLTEDELAEHLAGLASYGTYTITPPNTVTYIVLDLDTYEPEALERLKAGVEKLLVDPLGEWDDRGAALLESSGGKGYHVWIFLDAPITARRARQWVTPYFEDLVRDYKLEIFPKQDFVKEDSFGNLLKLPLGRHAKTSRRSEFVPVTGWGKPGFYPEGAVPTSHIPEETAVEPSRALAGESGATPFPCISTLKEGVGVGQRDDGAFRLACYYHQHGIDEDLALEQLERDNDRNTPPLEGWEVEQKLKSAYAGGYGVGCDAFLQSICPGGDDCKARVPGKRPGNGSTVGSVANNRKSYVSMTPEERKAFRDGIRSNA